MVGKFRALGAVYLGFQVEGVVGRGGDDFGAGTLALGLFITAADGDVGNGFVIIHDNRADGEVTQCVRHFVVGIDQVAFFYLTNGLDGLYRIALLVSGDDFDSF